MLQPPCAYTHESSTSLHGSATTTSLSYLEQWKQQTTKNNKNRMIVFDAVWWNSSSSASTITTQQPFWLLMACTNTGEIVIWKQLHQNGKQEMDTMEQEELIRSRRCSDSDDMDLSEAPDRRMSTTPFVRVQVSTGVLYSMKMVTLPSDKILLIVSGDEGIRILDWTTGWANLEAMGLSTSSTSTSSSSPPLVDVSIVLPCLAKYQTYPSPHEGGASVEINGFDLLLHSNYIIGAAGDAFGAYKWNLETQQLIATYPSALPVGGRNHSHNPYLHTIKTLQSNHHANDDKLVLMGGEGGLLSLWDGQQDKRIDQWNLGTTTPLPSAKSSTPTTAWISSIETLSNDTWWMAGGGMTGGSGTSPSVGFWSAFHGPTRSRITVPAPATVAKQKNHQTIGQQQQPQSYPQQQYTRAPITKLVANESTASWYSVGLEGVVRNWSFSSSMEGYDNKSGSRGMAAAGRRTNSQQQHYHPTTSDPDVRPRAVWCDVPCAYAIAFSHYGHQYDDDDDTADVRQMVAIGGVGSVVNVFKEYSGVLVADQSLTIE